ncbi:MAG TPA: alpha/beta fold hydrolase [Polyangiaceae bacterium]
MTTKILFLQGGGKGAHDEWDSKLVASLEAKLGAGYAILYPRLPNEGSPKYAAWKRAIAKELAALPDGSIVVAHSIGATIFVNAIADEPPPKKLAGIFLLATPFVGKGGWPSDEIEPHADLATKMPEKTPIRFFHGTADETAPPAHLELYRRAIPRAHFHALDGRDHQLNEDLTEVAKEIAKLDQ